MAKKTAAGNKSAFIRDVFTSNPEATSKDVAAAWAAAGHKEKLNIALFYNVKSGLGLTKKRRPKRQRRKQQAGQEAITAAPITNKSAFIRSVLEKDPAAKFKDVQAGWRAAGMKKTLNGALYYQVKKRMGLGPKTRRRARKAVKMAAAPAAAVPARSESYLGMERELERLIVVLDGMKDARLAEELRGCRRRVSAKLLTS